jgi:DNA-3-methyladenine glycosylase
MKLKRKFFNRKTLIVAKDLLGMYLVRRMGNKVIKARITEVEAYCGIKDKACHASIGLTPRTKIMFGPPGHAYVYMIYGMYHCLNFVTEKEGDPSAVLIRGGEIINGLPRDGVTILRGPGKLCRELKIDRRLNGIDIIRSKELWVESNNRQRDGSLKIEKAKRIGVDYAGKWKNKLWRFYIR